MSSTTRRSTRNSNNNTNNKRKQEEDEESAAALADMVFCLSGKFSESQAAITQSITTAGGKVRSSLTKDVTHLLTNGGKNATFFARNLSIVNEEWLQEQLNSGNAVVGGKNGSATTTTTSSSPAKKKAKTSTTPTTPSSTKAGLKGIPSPAPVTKTTTTSGGAAAVDAGVARLIPGVDASRIQVVTTKQQAYDVRLALVEPQINSDKYYILQLLVVDDSEDNDDDDEETKKYYVYARWGRTGTSGQGKLDGPYDALDDAHAVFAQRFHDKTGYDWNHAASRQSPHTAPLPGKYTYLQYNAAVQQQAADEQATWQYYLHNDPMGKSDGWYDYDKDNSHEVEQIFSVFSKHGNKQFSTRFITSESSGYTYMVDLQANTQTNTSSRTMRPIRRALPDEKDQLPTGPPANHKLAGGVAQQSPVRPIQAQGVAVKCTPTKANVTATAAAQTSRGSVDAAAPSHLRNGGTIYGEFDAMLNQADLKKNANKFIKVQLVETSRGVFLHKRWGRVGEAGQQQQVGPLDSDKAEREFDKYFKSKTGNKWDERQNFKPKSGKYTLIEMEANSDEDNNGAAASSGQQQHAAATKKVKSLPCALPSPVKEFVELIFNEDMFKDAMSEMQIDANRLPLGALSKAQVQKGREVLECLEEALNDAAGADAAKLEALSGEFYTVIPHAFGRRRPPAINTKDALNKKFEMLNTLEDIEAAQEVMNTDSSKEELHVTDANYEALRVDLEEVTQSGSDKKEWELIHKYLGATSGGYGKHMNLEHIMRVNRHGEDTTFQPHDALQNRRLLWHGTNVAVVAAILKSGLRIMPHSGGRVGKGIYLADMHEKSASYTCQGRGKIIMFLVEAALGTEHSITRDDPSLKCAPKGCHSVVARGKIAPDPKSDTTIQIDGRSVVVPQCGAQSTAHTNSSFHHNEFLIYQESQHRIRYVLQFKTI